MLGVLDHEIGTHFMRAYNERFQIWHKKRDQCGMKSCIRTEEGFATINQFIRMVSVLLDITTYEGRLKIRANFRSCFDRLFTTMGLTCLVE